MYMDIHVYVELLIASGFWLSSSELSWLLEMEAVSAFKDLTGCLRSELLLYSAHTSFVEGLNLVFVCDDSDLDQCREVA